MGHESHVNVDRSFDDFTVFDALGMLFMIRLVRSLLHLSSRANYNAGFLLGSDNL